MNRQEGTALRMERRWGEDRSDGSAAAGDGGHAATSLSPDVNGTHLFILEVHYLDVCVVGTCCI